jgi:hypothetical protein
MMVQGVLNEQLANLKRKYPANAFVFIFQTTKDGNFCSSNSFQYDVNVVVEVADKGKAMWMCRFCQDGSIKVW